ncbi:kinase-like domain, phloem protein 2-like protein, partial [Tanacetum coccineum]
MFSYQLTKESDVYSFGVVLLEVLFGRVCYENTDRQLKIFVPYWKKCYEQKKLDEIIFPDLMSHMNPSSLEIFVDIAYQCLRESREQRPTMSAVVENLKMALNCQELLHFKPSEYEQIIQAADPPVIYKSNMELIETLTKGVRVNGGKTVELHDQGLEEYQDIVKVESQSLFYKSLEELKVLLTKGFHINNHKTWFSLNENGEHCEMLSISHCLISREGGYSIYYKYHSRFPSYVNTNKKGFKVHVRTQFLTPLIDYTVNLVFCKHGSCNKQKYVGLRYKLEGDTETSIVYLANETKDNCSFIAELYQFTSNGRIFDLQIVFEDHKNSLEVEGILFQPLEKVEHEQVLDDENLSYNNLQWTIMKEEKKRTNLLKWFKKEHKLLANGQEAYAVDKDGMKSVMFSARGVIHNWDLSFQSSTES